MKRLRATAIGLAWLGTLSGLHVPVPAHAEELGFKVGVGGEYTTGKYGGQQSIDEVYVPVNFIYDAPRVEARVTLPYLSVRAPEGTVTEGPDGQPVIGEGPVKTEGGLGDVIAALTVYDVLSLAGGDFVVDVTGKIKFGTADEKKGLGTGENDYSLQADVFRFFDRFTILGLAGYVMRGDPPGVDLRDGFFASAGVTRLVADRTRLGLFYDYRESSLQGNDALQEFSVTLSSRLATNWWASGYLLAGVGDNSPDWGGGISLTAGF
jgi:hypothetical protein